MPDVAKQPDAGPDYRYLTGNAEAGWDSAVIYGIPLGKAAFKPRIVGSQLELPPMQVTAGQGAEGKINLAGRVDLRNDPPRLVVGKLRAVDGLKITKDFKWPQMGEFFPFFGDMAGVTGIVSVNVDALDYPLGKDGLKKMTGRGSVEMVNFRVQPKGLFGILGKIAGIAQLAGGDIKEVPTTVAPFEIKDGRVYYENLTLWLGNDFDVRISGWVGFDDKIDMKATIPATLGLLKRVPTKNLRMRLNITGTRQAPRISVLGSLLPTGAGKKVGDGIGDALKGIGDLLDRDKK